MKKMFYLVQFIFLFSLTIIIFKAKAQTESEVGASVTFQNVAVTISSGSVNYGTLAALGRQNTYALGQSQVATNAGNVNSIFTIKGTSTVAWSLAASTAANAYTHKFCTSACSTAPTNYTALGYGYATLAGSVAAAGTSPFNLEIGMPTTSSSYTVQSPNVTVMTAAN